MPKLDVYLDAHRGGFSIFNKWLQQSKLKVVKIYQVNILKLANPYRKYSMTIFSYLWTRIYNLLPLKLARDLKAFLRGQLLG